jgi:hypothetical protein
MKLRLAMAAAATLLATTATISTAHATGAPQPLRRLAIAQTKLLFRFYNGQPQTVSPLTCHQRRNRTGEAKVLLLPTLSFGSGDDTITCATRAHAAFVDLGGFTVTEDKRGDTYTLADGQVVTFARANLQRICNDAIRLVPTAPATLDGRPVAGTPVITRDFTVTVNPGANNTPGSPYYQDSVDLGHPGTLTACYVGYKALLPLARGHQHVLRVDLSAIAGAATTVTYVLDERRH